MAVAEGSVKANIYLPDNVKYIINTIYEAGYEAYAVGGCIRDSLLGKKPADYDITTSAKPDVIKKLFRRTIDTGIQHGTVTVMLKDNGYEITTYRVDGEYEDNRHPKSVSFTSSLKEDLLRRDFTINAMAYNDKEGLVDLFGGQEDLKNGIIRCVGIPYERFTEDALRVMRAVRFAAQLGYNIEADTLNAMSKLSRNLKNVSMERIQVELVKMITSNHPELIRTAYEAGITKVFLPEFDEMMKTPQKHPHHMYSVGEHTIKAIQEIDADKYLRLAMLFHDMGKPATLTLDEDGTTHFHGHPAVSERICKEVLKRLKFDNDTIRIVSKLVLMHDCRIDADKKSVRRAMNKIGPDIFPMLFKVSRADILAQSNYLREEKIGRLADLELLYNEICEADDCISIKSLMINGNDLISLGCEPGCKIGDILNRLLDRVLDDPSLNDKETLLRMAKEELK